MKKWSIWRIVLFCLILAVFLYAAVRLILYWHSGYESRRANETLTESVVSTPAPVPTPAEEETAEEEPEGYTEYAPIRVDFDALRAQNDDVIAWLYCEDTYINYPVAQGPDNFYYLERLLNGQSNPAGTIFLDSNYPPDFSGFNHAIYGHNMVNGTMFGKNDEYKKQEYYDEHPLFYLLTPEQYYKAELIGGYVTDPESIAFLYSYSEEERKEFIETALRESTFVSEAEPGGPEDHYITLTTCSYEFEWARYVLIARLVPVGGAEVVNTTH